MKNIPPPDVSEFDPIASITRWRERPNLTSLAYWFPLVRDAGLPVPLTEIVQATVEEEAAIWRLFDGEAADIEPLVGRIRSAAERIGGVPVFLRTALTSAKHDWRRSCYVSDLADLGRHVFKIAEFSGCVDLAFDTWVVREMLPTAPAFTAFWGQMPITREFRLFVRDGVVDHEQPYWPPDSIDGHTDDEQWPEKLSALSRMDANTRAMLYDMTQRVSAAVPGYWSVDWLWTTDRGWVLTDMAEGDASFMWHPDALSPAARELGGANADLLHPDGEIQTRIE